MRRYFRSLIIIFILIAIAATSLFVQHIQFNFFGTNFNRGGDTPLGLSLGLDLQGGSHLVYQASKDITVSFEEIVSLNQVKDAISQIGLENVVIKRGEEDNFIISKISLQKEDSERIREGLLEYIGDISIFQFSLAPTDEQIEGVMSIIERRVNAFGVTEPSIQLMGSNRILVQLPNIELSKAKELIGETATLEFKERTINALQPLDITTSDIVSTELNIGTDEKDVILNLLLDSSATQEMEALFIRLSEKTEENINKIGYLLGQDALILTLLGQDTDPINVNYQEIEHLEDNLFLLKLSEFQTINEAMEVLGESPQFNFQELIAKLDTRIGLTGSDLIRAFAGQHPTTGEPIVSTQFNDRGARIFAEVTGRIAGTANQFAIFLDDEELLSPVAQQAITGGSAFIQGPGFTFDMVRTIAIQLESGRLPIPIEVIQERTVDATLGSDSLKKSVIAGLVGLAMVLIFMVFYYRMIGLVAGGALIVYTILVMAIFKLWPITLTLSGVAALILSIGMAVDANILIFERMKEELRAGRSLNTAVNEGFNRAWTSIRDSNISTIITCAILFWFGNQLGTSIIQGFALTLFVGVVVSMFTAITVSRTFVRVLATTSFAKRTNWLLAIDGKVKERSRKLQSSDPN
jgi:preprotein translocase subunit SecD